MGPVVVTATATVARAGRWFCWIARRHRVAGLVLSLLLAAGHGTARAEAGGGAAPTRAAPETSPIPRATPRVLVLYSDNRLLPANVFFDGSLREMLASRPGQPIECFSEFLDEVRFPARHDERMRDLLGAKYRDPPPDVIVAFAPPSLDFCLRHGRQLFPAVPIVFAAIGSTRSAGSEVAPRVTGVRPSFDAPATLRLALRLHPRTRQVFVVASSDGADSTASAVGGSGSTVLRESEFRTPFHRLASRPLPALLEALSRLPDNSVVIDLAAGENSPGSTITPHEAAERMARASRAPIYSPRDPLTGYGLVGAVTTPMDEIGRAAAAMVLQVLFRDDPDELPPVQALAATPIVDWRQLRRWGIRKSLLPSGTIVRFQPPSFWRQHLVLVITTGALFLLQSGLILALVLQSRRRRRAEQEAQRRRQELAHMTRVATVGELTASLAHEINQPLAAILSNAQAGQRLLASGTSDGQEIREILSDIVADDQRAGEVIRRMRALLRKGESDPTILDANALVAEVVALVHGEMILHNVSLSLDLSPVPPLVHGDRVQLQQVLLNLMMNAMEAMKETPGTIRRLVVRTTPNGRSVRVAVEDSGAGIPPDKLEQVFEPFVTTKPQGLGLGLAICRSIIQEHGGRIGSANNPGRGTTFWFTLPAAEVKP